MESIVAELLINRTGRPPSHIPSVQDPSLKELEMKNLHAISTTRGRFQWCCTLQLLSWLLLVIAWMHEFIAQDAFSKSSYIPRIHVLTHPYKLRTEHRR